MTELSFKVDGLHRYQDELERDFCFRDIIPEIKKDIPRKLFNELNTLTKEEKLKVEKILSYFIYTKKDVDPFLRILKKNYNWIYEEVINSKYDKWIQDFRKAIQDVPNNSDWNVHRINYLENIQQHLKVKASDRKKYLILFGKLGFGKKWLAADAVRHYGIVSRMNFRIFWLNASKCCSQELILEKMHRLKVMLQADEFDMKFNAYNGNTKNQIVHLRNYLRKLLEKPQFRDCLVVLVDVQDENICKAFFELPCKFLITTRHIERLEFIPQEHKTLIEINEGFNIQESQELFGKAFPNCVLPNDMFTYVNNFHNACNGHPFILSLIAKSFQHFNESQTEREKRSENWIKSLNEYEIHDREDLIKMSMVKSMSFLKDEYQNYYKMMVIFTDNRDVPFSVLERLWRKNFQETEAIVIKLQKYSLLESHLSEQNEKTCSLHYLHYHFLLQEIHEDDQIIYHQQLIDSYEVDKIIRERKDLNLDFPRDNYFHYFIPYHLVGSNRRDLFRLYLDFDFLEQKMRFTRLTNTVGDLRRFAEFIVDGHKIREEFLNELVIFLPNSEQQLYESNDVNLLQLALNSSGKIQEEAKRQIKNFPDRVWMEDINHDGDQTQIVQINANSQPQIVRFVKPNDDVVCLIALKDSNILLQHIVHNYHNVALLYKNEQHSEIIDLQVFRDQNFLSLTKNGKLCVYSLKNVPARENTLPLPVLARSNANNENLIQRIDGGSQEEIACFIVTNDEISQVDLIVGLSHGNLRFFSWINNRFEEDKKLMIKSKFTNLHRFVKIEIGSRTSASTATETEGNAASTVLYEYLMLMNQHGDVRFVDLKSSGEMPALMEWKKLDCPINLHQGESETSKEPITICVGKNKIVQATHKKILNGIAVDVEFQEIYSTENDHEILSSAMSTDSKYVVLGTTKGIFVFNRKDREVVMRKNISDKVLSLDLIHDDEAMYILSSVFEDSDKVISLHGFDEKTENYKLMPILAGGDLFDVKQNSTEWEMIAFDDKKDIQFRNSTDEFGRASTKKKSYYDVKKLIYADDKIIIGCTNGWLRKIDLNGRQQLICSLASEITYLEMVDGKIISSCNSEYVIIEFEKEPLRYFGKITKAYLFNEKQILLVRKNCSVEILNTSTREKSGKALTNNADEYCTAQAFLSQTVFVASSKKRVYTYSFEEKSDVEFINFDESSAEITALAVSRDKTILAVGFANGLIEIVDILNSTKLKKLSAAHDEGSKKGKEINNLYFSPWQSPNEPMILLSVSSSIIFWDIKSIQNNNSLEMARKISTSNRIRVSSRFRPNSKNLSLDWKLSEETQRMSINVLNPWSRKTGSNERPEILSCHKLIGKSAKKVIVNDEFDKFLTIDNEGNIYYLRLITKSSDNNETFDHNGNPSQ